MRTMREAIALAIDEMGDPAGIGDVRLEVLELRGEVVDLEVEGEGPFRCLPGELELVEVIELRARFQAVQDGHRARGEAPVGAWRRLLGSDDDWRDQASARREVLDGVVGVLLGQGVCREDVADALRSLESSSHHLTTA